MESGTRISSFHFSSPAYYVASEDSASFDCALSALEFSVERFREKLQMFRELRIGMYQISFICKQSPGTKK